MLGEGVILIVLLELDDNKPFLLDRFANALSARAGVTFARPLLYRRTQAQRTPEPHLFNHVVFMRHEAAAADLAKPADDELMALDALTRFAVGDYAPLNAAVRVREKPVAIQLSFTSALPGKSAEFEEWYETYHFPDGLRLPGFAGGQRFRRKSSTSQRIIPMAVLASYQLDTMDVGPTIQAIGERAGTPEFRLSDAMDPHYWAWFFVPAATAE